MQVLISEDHDSEGAHHPHSAPKQEETALVGDQDWNGRVGQRPDLTAADQPDFGSSGPTCDIKCTNTDKAHRTEDPPFQQFLQVTKRKKRRLSSIMFQAALHPITGDVIGTSSPNQRVPSSLMHAAPLSLMDLCFKSLINSANTTPLETAIATAPRDVLVRLVLFSTTGHTNIAGIVGLIEAQAAVPTKQLPIATMTPRQATMIVELIQHLLSSGDKPAVSFGRQSPTCMRRRDGACDDETLALRYCQLVLSRHFKYWEAVEESASQWLGLTEVHRLSNRLSGTRTAELFYINALIQLGLATREQRNLDRSERLLQHAQDLCLMRLLHAVSGTSPTSPDRTVLHSNEELLDLAEHHHIDIVHDSFAKKLMHLYLSSYQHMGLTLMANAKPLEAIHAFETAIRTWNTILTPLRATQPACQCCNLAAEEGASGRVASCPGLQYNLFLLSLAHQRQRNH